MPHADLILLDGVVLEGHRVDLAVVGSTIAEIAPAGKLKHRRHFKTRVHRLEGRLLTPGLWDTHIHLYHWSQARKQLNLSSCSSREELFATLAEAEPGTGWLLGHGWTTSSWPDATPPTRQELDRLTGDRPTLLWCSDLHSAIGNSAAMSLAGLLEEGLEIEGGVIERGPDGTPTGWVKELAANAIRQAVPEPSRRELAELLLEGAQELHSYGITGVCDQRIKDQDDGRLMLSTIQELEAEGAWKLRTSVNVAAHHLDSLLALGLCTGFGNERVRLGHLKLFADGTLGSRTARMLQPFRSGGCGPDGHGLYLTSPKEMRETFRRAASAGWSLSVHAIGDEANRICLDLFEELDELEIPRPRIPHRIEHVQILDDADLERFAKLNITASMQPGHLIDDRAAADDALGERARLAYRLADLHRAGARLAFGSDAPVSHVDPRYGLQAALFRGTPAWYPEQVLPAEVAWKGYTETAALASGWQHLTGSLRVGLRADLVVWESDPTQPGEGAPAQTSHTVFDGRIVFSRE